MKIKYSILFGKLNSLMQIMVYISYLLLFFNNDNLKYTTISETRSFNSFSLFHNFILLSFYSFILLSFYPFIHVYNLYFISYTFSFCYVMYYIVSEIYIGRRFLEDCYCYCHQIIFGVAKESLVHCNLRQKSTKNTDTLIQ